MTERSASTSTAAVEAAIALCCRTTAISPSPTPAKGAILALKPPESGDCRFEEPITGLIFDGDLLRTGGTDPHAWLARGFQIRAESNRYRQR